MTAPVDVAKLRADIAYDEAQGNDVDSALEPCLDEIERLREERDGALAISDVMTRTANAVNADNAALRAALAEALREWEGYEGPSDDIARLRKLVTKP